MTELAEGTVVEAVEAGFRGTFEEESCGCKILIVSKFCIYQNIKFCIKCMYQNFYTKIVSRWKFANSKNGHILLQQAICKHIIPN